MSGLREVPGNSRVLTHTTESHSPALIGSRWSQIFSWLLPGKKRIQKEREQNSEKGGVRRGVGVRVGCGRWGSGRGRSEKKGRMLRTVEEEVSGISS